MKARIGLAVGVVAVLSLCLLSVQAFAAEKAEKKGCKEVKVTLRQLPTAVRATLQRQVGNGKIDEIEKTVSGTTVTYSADITKGGRKYDVEIAANGKLIKVEEDKPGEEEEDESNEVKVTLNELPPAVRAVLQNQVGSGTIDEIEKGEENGQTVYSADITRDGKKYDVDIASDGRLIKVEADKPRKEEEENEANEVKITLGELPPAVRATLEKEVGSGTIDEIEKGTEHGQTVYSADITKDGKKYDVDIAPDGKLIKTEIEKPKEHKSEAAKEKDEDEAGEED